MSGIVGGAGSKSGIIGQTEIEYEEGSWTPAHGTFDIGGNTAGRYIKIGRQVTVWGKLDFGSGNGSGTSSSASFSGLPFTTSGVDWAGTGSINRHAVDLYSSYETAVPKTATSNTTWTFYCNSSGDGGWNDTIEAEHGSIGLFMIVYEAAS